jgi:hypothetical protein
VSDLTQLLSAIDAGDPKASDQLLPLVYEELRKLPSRKIFQHPWRDWGRENALDR